jgi:hypothetical protein
VTELEQWLSANGRFLATQLEALRARLERQAGTETEGTPTPREVALQPSELTKPKSWRSRMFAPRAGEIAAPPVLLAPPPASVEAEPVVIEPSPDDPPPALMVLARRLGLSEFERNTLFLCAAMELDTRMGALCARAQHDPSRPYPTFALALSLFDQPSWDVLSPERPLREWLLLKISQPGAQPLIASALCADERIVAYIKGLNYLDDRLAPLVTPVGHSAATLPASQTAVADIIAEHLNRRGRAAGPPAYQLLGSDTRSKLAIALNVVERLGLSLYRLQADAIPTAAADFETFARLWQRECALLPIALYIDASQVAHAANTGLTASVQKFLRRGAGIVFLDTPEPWPDLSADAFAVHAANPTAQEQQIAWTAVLGDAAGDLPAQLAAQFNFDIASIAAIARDTDPHDGSDAQVARDRVWDACIARTRPALDQLAQPIDAKAGWDDLVLPATETALLHQIADQVAARMTVYDNFGFAERMNRGLGISVLFAGESGCGKTMAAEVIANALRLALYRIDLSAVVSKFIGETEKNLRLLFDAAENGGAILFFDEADALFGRRSEVKDSHDRYANIEINYLLQRMESYRGIAILATNMKSSLDEAFLRRLRFIVNFPFPGPQERQAIWQKVFPQRTPQEGLDFARLARLNLTGGSIHNIALNAAFMAAHAKSPVTMALVLDAARAEFRRYEKPVNEADFRQLASVRTKP